MTQFSSYAAGLVGKLYFKIDSYLPDFRDSVIFPYISLYTQAVAYTTYVKSAARRALKNTSKRRLLSLGSLCSQPFFGVVTQRRSSPQTAVHIRTTFLSLCFLCNQHFSRVFKCCKGSKFLQCRRRQSKLCKVIVALFAPL